MSDTGQSHTDEETSNNNISFDNSKFLRQVIIEPYEHFLNNYSRHMNSIRDAGQGFIALHELLSSNVDRDITLSDS